MSGSAGRYQRSAGGMVGAMLVLVVVVVGFVALRELNRTPPRPGAAVVDYRQSAAFARAELDFEVLSPASLPEGWRATSVEVVAEPGRWHLGLLTEDDEYVGLEQGHSPVRSMLTTYVDGRPDPTGTVGIEGTSWRSWAAADGDTALTHREDGVTTLVVGPVPLDLLVDYVWILRGLGPAGSGTPGSGPA